MPFFNSYQRARLLLLLVSALCFGLFWWAGDVFRIPLHVGYEASLLQQPAPLLAFLLIVALLAVCALIGTVVAGSIRFDAGLVVAALGLAALSFRGGPMRYTLGWGLAHDTGPRIFIVLLFETIVLALLIAGFWQVLDMLFRRGLLKDREPPTSPPTDKKTEVDGLAILLQTALTAFGVMLLAQSDDKRQATAAVFIAALLAPIVLHPYRPAHRTSWNWLPPLLVGIIGYAAAFWDPRGLEITILSGPLAALARPLPLDYASAGIAGALIGHWLARRSERLRAAAPAGEAAAG